MRVAVANPDLEVATESALGSSKTRPTYARSARIFSIGIASTGLVTFAYFALASHALSAAAYSGVSLLWSVMFVIVSVIYRPIEQLLSRTIADRRARGLVRGHPLRVPLVIQATFAAVFAGCALAFRSSIEVQLFHGSSALYWVLFVGVLAYAASYFARGWLAGHQWFGLYGGLVFMEACSRVLFAVIAVVGIAHGQTVVAMGIAAAPFISLVVVPWAFSRVRRERESESTPSANVPSRETELDITRGGKFAVFVLIVMLAEQTLLNGAVLTVNATAGETAVVGFVFNVLLIARAPLQVFQAVQGSLLPHLAGLHATSGRSEFSRAIRITVLAIAGFALLVAVGLVTVGPFAMGVLFHKSAVYGRWGLALVGLGMGAHLIAGTLNQAALAREHAGAAAVAWLVSASAFVGWMLSPIIENQILRAEVGYSGGAALLCVLLAIVYKRGNRA